MILISTFFLLLKKLLVTYLLHIHLLPLSYINTIPNVSPLWLFEVDVQEVVDYIFHLDSRKSVGVDCNPAKFVKASPVNMPTYTCN